MRLIFIIVVLVLSSCSVNQFNDYALKTGLEKIQLGVIFIDSNKQKITADSLPESTYITFPVIPGGITGQVLTDSMYTVKVLTDSKFSLDLAAISKNILPYAVPMFSTSYNQDVVIIPKETKLLRIGTFAHSTKTYEQIGATGIASVGQNEITQMMLVYFDRPARVSGLNNEEGIKIEYDVMITQPGFVFLQVIEINETHFRITVSDSQEAKVITIEYEQVTNIST